MEAHPNADPRLLDNFKNGRISIGMDEEQVRVVMGRPWHIETSQGIGGSFDLWSYLDPDPVTLETAEPDIFLYFSDGILVRWQNLK
jgi:hypothetical protein